MCLYQTLARSALCLTDMWNSLILLMIIRTFYLYAVYSEVLCTSCRLLSSGPCPNGTVCLVVTWDSLLPVVYQVVIFLYNFFLLIFILFLYLHQAHARTTQSTQWIFTLLFMCLHRVLSQTAHCTQWLLLLYQKFSNYSTTFLFYCRMREHSMVFLFSFFICLFSFSWKINIQS